MSTSANWGPHSMSTRANRGPIACVPVLIKAPITSPTGRMGMCSGGHMSHLRQKRVNMWGSWWGKGQTSKNCVTRDFDLRANYIFNSNLPNKVDHPYHWSVQISDPYHKLTVFECFPTKLHFLLTHRPQIEPFATDSANDYINVICSACKHIYTIFRIIKILHRITDLFTRRSWFSWLGTSVAYKFI